MEEYRDLDLTIAVFTRILDQPQLRDLEAGIVLQAYLPDALGALHAPHRVGARAPRRAAAPASRCASSRAPTSPMERVDAAVHGWPLAT